MGAELAAINQRVIETYPQLSADAETLNIWCVQVREFAFTEVALFYASEDEDRFERAMQTTRQKYPRVSEANLSRLYNQGIYYAWHG